MTKTVLIKFYRLQLNGECACFEGIEDPKMLPCVLCNDIMLHAVYGLPVIQFNNLVQGNVLKLIFVIHFSHV